MKGLPHGVKPSLRLVDRISPFVHRFLAIRFRQRLAKAAHCQPSIRAFRNVVRALNPHLASHWLKVINCRTTRRDARLFKPLQSACSNSLVVLGPSRHRRHLSQKDNPFIGHIELILANPRSMKRRDFMTLIGGGGVPARRTRATAGGAGDRVSEQSATVARPYFLLYKGQDVVASNAATPPSRHTHTPLDLTQMVPIALEGQKLDTSM